MKLMTTIPCSLRELETLYLSAYKLFGSNPDKIEINVAGQQLVISRVEEVR